MNKKDVEIFKTNLATPKSSKFDDNWKKLRYLEGIIYLRRVIPLLRDPHSSFLDFLLYLPV